MSKIARSWSKLDGVSGLIGRKKVDQSIFKYGTHIPLIFYDDFQSANKGDLIESGSSHKLELLINDNSYDATMFHYSKGDSDKDAIHIRYDGKKELLNTLKTILKNSYNYLQNEISKRPEGDRALIDVPDEYAEYIDFYETGEPYKYRLEIITSKKPIEKTDDNLSEPFNEIFKNRQAANWAFDFLKESCDRLKITGPNDMRFAVTLPHNKRVLRLNMGSWAVLQFYSPDYSQYNIGIALIEEQTNIEGPYKSWGAFAHGSPSISVYEMSIELGEPLENNIRQVYEKTFSLIAETFRNWKSSPARRAHRNDIAEAIFDISKREKLFDEGISDVIEEPAPNIWWVNQGTTLNKEKEEAILWAPIKSSNGKTLNHWETMTEVREGDIILHYANGALRYVSEVIEPAIETKKPTSLEGQAWDEDGRLIKTEYYKLEPDIKLEKFSEDVLALNIDQGPLDVKGKVKQGYLFRFNAEALTVIQQAQPETDWPEFSRIDMSHVKQWIFQANPKQYDLTAALAELKKITWLVNQSKNQIGVGDQVFLWEAGDNAGIVAVGRVESNPQMIEQDSTQAKFNKEAEKFEGSKLRVWIAVDRIIEPRIMRQTLLEHPVLKNLSILSFANATNFKISSEEADLLLKMINKDKSDRGVLKPSSIVTINSIYTVETLTMDTGLSTETVLRWIKALDRKHQVILYGPPGTGKTYVAELLAKHIIGGADGFYSLVQFHPAYAYEDFMQGIRAISNNGRLEYPMVKGRFLDFCEKASKKKNKCVLIIDEINRANLPRVFGELMYLLEYRDRKIPLSNGGELSIPQNVYIIGTMNTADRSIALVDHALRRRFAFLSLRPNYDILRKYHAGNGNTTEGLIRVLNQINKQIGDPHYEIGVSFFLLKDLKNQLEDIWRMEIEPYLEEYFFDQPDKAKEFRWESISEQVFK